MSTLRSRTFLSALLICFPAVVGCGNSSEVRVTGTLNRDGKPYACDEKMYVQILFVPESGPGNSHPAEFNHADGTFEIASGKNKTGVPPGRYKVAVEIRDYSQPKSKGASAPPADLLAGRYNQQNTRIVVDVDGSSPISIDLK